MERYMGNGVTQLDIVMPSPVWRAGESITGHVVLRPQQDLPTAEVAVYWAASTRSSSVAALPCRRRDTRRPRVFLGKKIPLQAGAEFGLPFAVPLPADAAAVRHGSALVAVMVRRRTHLYSGFTSHQVERVRRPIVVVNAP